MERLFSPIGGINTLLSFRHRSATYIAHLLLIIHLSLLSFSIPASHLLSLFFGWGLFFTVYFLFGTPLPQTTTNNTLPFFLHHRLHISQIIISISFPLGVLLFFFLFWRVLNFFGGVGFFFGRRGRYIYMLVYETQTQLRVDLALGGFVGGIRCSLFFCFRVWGFIVIFFFLSRGYYHSWKALVVRGRGLAWRKL